MIGVNVFSSLLIIMLFIGLIVFIKRMSEKPSHKKLKWILGAYVAILIFSFIFIHTLSEEDFIGGEAGAQNGILVTDQERQNFYDAAMEGRLDELKKVPMTGQWSFEYTEDQLEIVSPGGDYTRIWVVVERKDVDDDKIKAASFTGRNIINGIDLTDKIKPPEVKVEGNQLKVIMPEEVRIELGRFDRDFTVKQFFPNGNNNRNRREMSSVGGPQVLYIQVPKGVQIDEENNFQSQFAEFQFVGE
ncbi:hypothetical protein GGQ84_001494 [Desulfitispora alkaliphila]|uniref:hypothetical protein n=1 Tax=Desulfitispora alkaliphila TaxID=622674 RepID=UPI003D1B76CE